MEQPGYYPAAKQRQCSRRSLGEVLTKRIFQAWLVCPDDAGNLDLYVNLGPYAYMTPAGCADETIHAYTGATATA